ncbi:MAG: nuclease [Candidatus Contendobacter odensis]|uniref:Nuclease n=1 Tax=Candidatus Contendibacter odensensis TaxID=1400860 RepID=A0A2G6PFV4_9GAMM|nr:MAG: nuclease [Candidatus Contendobacter odensis]
MKQEFFRFVQRQLRSELNRTHRRKRRSPWLIGGLVIAITIISYFLHEPKAPSSSITKGTVLKCSVKSVYDGDTLTANCPAGQVKVRLFGIDAPEMKQKPWGTRSRDVLRDLVATHDSITLQVKDQDRYGRTVAQVFAGELDTGLEMVRKGKAIVYRQYNKSPAYQQAEDEAKQAKRGIWRKSGNQQDPAAWRRLNPR